MKKFILLCTLLAICITFAACSKSEPAAKASSGIPDDLVLVLPDGQEIYLYMPHDDAAEILGPADEISDIGMGKMYQYNGFNLTVAYKDELLAYFSIVPGTPCKLKNGLNPSSGKSDFIKQGFSKELAPNKFYLIENGRYSSSIINPSLEEIPFQSAATIGSYLKYESADSPDFKGYPIFISDYYCAFFFDFDE